jgi:hypothetical protein
MPRRPRRRPGRSLRRKFTRLSTGRTLGRPAEKPWLFLRLTAIIPRMAYIKTKPSILGQKFGRLLAISIAGKQGNYNLIGCRCDCGRTHNVRSAHLRSGAITSCGCRFRTHGMTKTTEYNSWTCMRDRCNSPGDIGYANYGGRGIKVCERWNDSFQNFIDDMGPKPSPRHTIDRIDGDGDYEPSNCRWATKREQRLNVRGIIRLTHGGETLTLNEWGQRLGINPQTITNRVRAGRSPADCLSQVPLNGSKRSSLRAWAAAHPIAPTISGQ